MGQRIADALRKAVCALELYELVGLVASSSAVAVFFCLAGRLDARMGIRGYHWQAVRSLFDVAHNVLTWAFTATVTVLLLALWCLRRSRRPRAADVAYMVRVLLSFCVMMAIYKVVNAYITVFDPFDRDPALLALDRRLFWGHTPSEWLDAVASPGLTVIMNIAYLSWYALTYLTIVVMLWHSRRAAMEYVFTAVLTFYIGYMVYILVPAVGPLYTLTFTHDLGGLTDWFRHQQVLVSHDCFPSLHTALAMVMLVYAWRYQRRWTAVYAPICLLIVASTMYLRFHYGMDAIAGAALAGVTTQIGPLCVAAWDRLRSTWAWHTAANEAETGVPLPTGTGP
jgi:membrane-associated phospholipid phosphatase